jgi:hypothetical protein
VLNAARMEAKNTSCHERFQVSKYIGGGSGSDRGTREKREAADSGE